MINHSQPFSFTEVSIFRNFKGYLFSPFLSQKDKNRLRIQLDYILGKLGYLSRPIVLKDQDDRWFSYALISRELTQQALENRQCAVFYPLPDGVRLSLFEHEHLHFRLIEEGCAVFPIFSRLYQAQKMFQEQTSFAYDARFGFLCHAPILTGYGIVLRVHLHLARTLEKVSIKEIRKRLRYSGIEISALYPDRNRPAMVSFSFLPPMNSSLNDALSRLDDIVNNYRDEEAHLREAYFRQNAQSENEKYAALIEDMAQGKITSLYDFAEMIDTLLMARSLGYGTAQDKEIMALWYKILQSYYEESRPGPVVGVPSEERRLWLSEFVKGGYHER